jgi:hypothetical protein
MLRVLTLALMLLGPVPRPANAADMSTPFDSVLAAGSGDALQRRQQARALLSSGDPDAAVREVAMAAEESPHDAEAWSDYALALADAGQFRRAAAAVIRSLELDPQAFVANKVAIIVFERLGRHREAFETNERLAALGDRIAMYDLAEAFLEGRGVPADPPGAVRWMERAAAAGHFGAMERLALIYRAGLYGQTVDPLLSAAWAARAEAD